MGTDWRSEEGEQTVGRKRVHTQPKKRKLGQPDPKFLYWVSGAVL